MGGDVWHVHEEPGWCACACGARTWRQRWLGRAACTLSTQKFRHRVADSNAPCRTTRPARRIKDLGALPSDAFEKYRGKSAKELHKALAKVQEELGAYSHVNKKVGRAPLQGCVMMALRCVRPSVGQPRGGAKCGPRARRARQGVRCVAQGMWRAPTDISKPDFHCLFPHQALDQYVNFTEQREELHRRREEVLQGGERLARLHALHGPEPARARGATPAKCTAGTPVSDDHAEHVHNQPPARPHTR